MNPHRIHSHVSFFKYVTGSTALATLKHCKLRWSAPLLFNDPFDVPEKICDGIDETALNHALVDRMNRLVDEPFLPDPDHHSPMTKTILAALPGADEKLKKQLIAGNEEFRGNAAVITDALEEVRAYWRSIYNEQRILCLTERWDSASMWDRYCEGHKGAVLEFACLDKHDSAWLMAKPVRYSDDPLKLNTPHGFGELLFYNSDYAVQKIMEEYTHTKTTDWSYEREWRVASWKRTHESGSHSDYGFLPVELKSIILGARMPQPEINALLIEVAKTYPHAEVWRASLNGTRHMKKARIK